MMCPLRLQNYRNRLLALLAKLFCGFTWGPGHFRSYAFVRIEARPMTKPMVPSWKQDGFWRQVSRVWLPCHVQKPHIYLYILYIYIYVYSQIYINIMTYYHIITLALDMLSWQSIRYLNHSAHVPEQPAKSFHSPIRGSQLLSFSPVLG